MQFDFVSLFPDLLAATVSHGVTGRAVDQGLVGVRYWNPRDFTVDRYRTVDDRPYGGGPGMVMKVEPLRAAIAAARGATNDGALVIYLSPQGRPLKQADINRFASLKHIVLVAGRYEGIDERVIETDIDEEWSLGDYVISGGELAAAIVFDATVRLLPGVLGHEESAAQDSYMAGLLDCPHYTRPVEIEGRVVPAVLQSGNHEEIRRWRLKQALGRTFQRRPDLLEGRTLTAEEKRLLGDYLHELNLRSVQG